MMQIFFIDFSDLITDLYKGEFLCSSTKLHILLSKLTQENKTTFAELGLITDIIDKAVDAGYSSPTPIQCKAIPKILHGKNLVGKSATGSGKTAAFVMPLAQFCLNNRNTKVLILSPTRELAMQIHGVCTQLAPSLGTACIYGGVGYGQQIAELSQDVNIIVGTPGRVIDFIKSKKIELKPITHIVLDEADNMLNMGFVDDMTWIFDHLPSDIQKMMFSATIDTRIRKLVDRLMQIQYDYVSVASETRTATNIAQHYLVSPPSEAGQLRALELVLEFQAPTSTVIFVPTKISTSVVGAYLTNLGFKLGILHGDMDQRQREYIVSKFRKQDLQVLIATDVIARGLDIDHISHVINYGLPKDPDSYIHRVGRTGRVGRSGIAITILQRRELRGLRAIERATQKKMEEMSMPTKEEIYDNRVKHYLDQILQVSTQQNLQPFEDMAHKALEALDSTLLIKTLLHIIQLNRSIHVDTSTTYGPHEKRHLKPASNAGKRGQKYYSYKISMGSKNGIAPSDIFISLIKSLKLEKQDIGRIKILDNYSLVSLTRSLPQNIQDIFVLGKRSSISRNIRTH